MQTSNALNVPQAANAHTNPHEQLLEDLSTILLQLNVLQTLVHDDVPDITVLRSGLAELEQMTREVITDLRAADDDLPPEELAGVSLVEGLSRAVEGTAEIRGLSSRVAISGEERSLPSHSERLLFRIAQEALYQVEQHINAHKLRFSIIYGRDDVQMSIRSEEHT